MSDSYYSKMQRQRVESITVPPSAPSHGIDRPSTPFEQVVGYRQVTDAHLLTLAIRKCGILATFDRGVAELAPSIPASVELIP